MAKLYDVTWDEMEVFFERNMEYLFREPRPMPGAVENIQAWLEDGHEITFITARKPGAEEKVTLEWFGKYGIPINRAFFSGGASKTFAVKKCELDVFVEDFMSNALEIAALEVPVLLLDAPYNQGKLPLGVTRCYNWEEIRLQIKRLSQ